MFASKAVQNEIRRLAQEHGRDLADALLIASADEDVTFSLKRRMVRIVLDQIATMGTKLEDASFPDAMAWLYQHTAFETVQETILTHRALAVDTISEAA